MTESGKTLAQELLQRGRSLGTHVLVGAAGRGIGFSLALSALLILAGAFLDIPAGLRAIGVLLVLSIALGPVITALFRVVPSMFDAEESARATERESEEMRDRLVPAVQILRAREDSKTGYSHDLVDAFVDDVLRRLRAVDLRALPARAFARRGLLIAGAGAVLLAALFAALGPSRSGAAALRYATAFQELGPRPPADFEVEPGNVVIPRGSPVALAARVSGTPAPGVLETRGDPKSPWKEISLPASERYEHRFAEVEESFEYRFGQGRDRSETYRVEAIARTTVRVEEIRYRYPEYTGLAPASVNDGSGDLAAVKGTKAEILFRPSNPPRRAALLREKDAPLDLAGDEAGLYRAELAILQEDAYRVQIEDQTGTVNQDPITHRIQPLTDEAPFIRLLEPGEDRDLDESLKATLRYSAIDDYGLGPVLLRYESSRAPGEQKQVKIFTPRGRAPEVSESFEWSLADLELLPGDSVTYFLEVSDRNSVDGPSTSRTRSFVLRFPSLGEIYAEIDEGQESSIEEMKEVAGEVKKVEEKVEEIGREILKKGEASWENRQEMQRALETQQKLSAELQKIQEKVDQSMQSLLESEFMSFEALQKMEQLQKLLDEVTNQEMKEALEKLRKALEDNEGRKDQEIADFQKAQEELMKNLDRVIENLKQFRLEEKLKAAVRQLEELAARQERVNEDLKDGEQTQEPKEKKAGEESDLENKGEEGDEEKSGDEAKDEQEQDGEKSEDEAKENEGGENESESSDSKKGKEKSGEESAREKGSKKDEAGKEKENERLAQEEKALSEETKKLEEEMKELAKMVKELRDAQDQSGMEKVSEEMKQKQIPNTMSEMSQNMEKSENKKAEEQGEKALTELRETLTALTQQQQSMSSRQVAISQAAINRAVRDLLALSEDEESLAGNLEEIPRNTVSATRGFADEQRRLIQGAERVDKMLEEVAKGTPLMESAIGKTLDRGVESMRESAYGLESGAVQLANQEGEKAVDDLNAVVIQLLRASQSMSNCQSSNPMSGAMKQLQELSGDQEKLNQMMQQLREEMKSSPSRRLQGHLQSLADEQARIQEQLEKLLSEIGEGGGLLGNLDDVSQKLDDVAERMKKGDTGDQVLKDQEWALTRLLDSQRSIRERDFGKERRSKTGEELGQLTPPSDLPGGIDDPMRDLREDLLKALDRRYPPKYEDLIKRYFRSLSREESAPDLP